MIKTTLATILDDRVAYRNLEPVAPGLPGLRATWQEIGLDAYRIPRKTEPDYAKVLIHLIEEAQAQRGGPPLKRLLFIGDTPMNDAQAARNLGQMLPLRGFIGADRLAQPAQANLEGNLMIANRWGALNSWLQWLRDSNMPVDEGTALLLDIDKTLIGARGRNDHVIDAVRMAAIVATMRAALGSSYQEARFRRVYDRINQTAFHPFTKDNQDYVAYVCLMLIADIYDEARFWQETGNGTLSSFEDFVQRCDQKAEEMPGDLVEAHQQVVDGLAVGDPTPFKTFRRQEYLETLTHMDVCLDEDPHEWLQSEIVITAEVLSVAQWAVGQGALTFGLSDKPNEASLPTEEQAAQGLPPIHRATMKVYGEPII